jgi:WD40 repeat protein
MASFSPDGRLLALVTDKTVAGAAGGAKGTQWHHELTILEAGEGRILARRPVTLKHQLQGYQFAFRPDGKSVALPVPLATAPAGDLPRTVQIWEAADGWQGRILPLLSEGSAATAITALAFSPDGRRLAVWRRNRVSLCDGGTGEILHTFPGGFGYPWGAVFTADGKRLFLRSDHGEQLEIKVWDTDTGRELLTLPLRRDAERNAELSLHPDGPRLLIPASEPGGPVEVEFLNGAPLDEPGGR